MKKKISIVTINDYNYGNRLQNYALQVILNNFAIVETIYFLQANKNKKKISIIIKKFLGKVKKSCQSILFNITGKKRELSFDLFNKKYIKYSNFIYAKDIDYKKLNEKYDYFVSGSDQIWNPNFFNDMSFPMLTFAPDSKKIAIAPSIGVEKLTEEQTSIFKTYLKNFYKLSCREQQGADMLANLLDREVVSLIDPTLMLNQDDWDKIAKKPKFHDEKKKYILLYFLGQMTNEYKNIILKIQETYNLDVINLYDKANVYYTCGPSEFVWLIKHCTIMLTDSFHGSVFSYIYDKPFKIFQRQDNNVSMNSRLTNLIDKLCLDKNIYITKDFDVESILDCKYDKKHLITEQNIFKNYLDNIFDKVGEK